MSYSLKSDVVVGQGSGNYVSHSSLLSQITSGLTVALDILFFFLLNVTINCMKISWDVIGKSPH